MSVAGCRAWILGESGKHRFAGGNNSFHFEEIQIYGNAQLAVKTDILTEPAFKYYRYVSVRDGSAVDNHICIDGFRFVKPDGTYGEPTDVTLLRGERSHGRGGQDLIDGVRPGDYTEGGTIESSFNMKGSTGAGPNSEYTGTTWCAFSNPDIMLTFEEPEAFTNYKMYVQGGCENSPQEWKILGSDDKDAATDSWLEVAHESTVRETQRLQFDATKHDSHSACVSGKANGFWGNDKKTSVTISSVTIPLETSNCQVKWTSIVKDSRDGEVDRLYVKVQLPGQSSASWVEKWSKAMPYGSNYWHLSTATFDCPAGSNVMIKFTSDINQG